MFLGLERSLGNSELRTISSLNAGFPPELLTRLSSALS